MKRIIIIILLLAIASTVLVAANPWKSRLVIINKTGEDIHIFMEYPYTWLKVPYIEPENKSDKPKTVFTIERDVYTDVEISACGYSAVGTMNLNRNLQLTFVPCDEMIRYEKPRFLGEPSLEKPNWFREPGMANWQWKPISSNSKE